MRAAFVVFCGLALMGCTSSGYRSVSLRPDLILVGRITSVSDAEWMIGDVAAEAKVYAFQTMKDRVASKSITFVSEGRVCPDGNSPHQFYLVLLHEARGYVGGTKKQKLYEAWWCDVIDESQAESLSSFGLGYYSGRERLRP